MFARNGASFNRAALAEMNNYKTQYGLLVPRPGKTNRLGFGPRRNEPTLERPFLKFIQEKWDCVPRPPVQNLFFETLMAPAGAACARLLKCELISVFFRNSIRKLWAVPSPGRNQVLASPSVYGRGLNKNKISFRRSGGHPLNAKHAQERLQQSLAHCNRFFGRESLSFPNETSAKVLRKLLATNVI